MGRQTKKCTKKCTKHFFSLKPVHYSAFFSRQKQFSYCAQNPTAQPYLPKFNRDRKFYTAAFILPADQAKLAENDKIHQTEHERFKQSNYQEKTEILVPKPRTKSYYCNVCKEVYDDYQDHISSLKHLQLIKSNQFNNDILALCKKFGNLKDKPSQTLFPEELQTSFAQKCSNYTLISSHQLENQKEKPSVEEPQLFLQNLTKENLNVFSFCQGLKSFHTFGENLNDLRPENMEGEIKVVNSLNKIQKNEGPFGQCSGFKLHEITASPIKTRFERPIILMGRPFGLDE